MKNVYIYCEGPTEESFVNEILYPYFFNMEIAVYPIICTTKRTASKKYKGGVRDYNKIRRELITLCKSHRNEYVTTMFDYYGMPGDTPAIGLEDPDIYKRINNSFETAPSKRLEKLIPNYAKIKNGILISKDMGIDKMIDEGPHFREWVEKIISDT